MRAVSIHVDDRDYQRFKVLASKSGRSVADLIREAMATFLKCKAFGLALYNALERSSGAFFRLC